MSKIRILPEQLANRIAAGEVVERPASVVKELLENSLDAGATRIEIEIEGSGTRLIRVLDNGEGMDEDDMLLCLERHGTSKITDNHDLAAISSLGFRGEAIPSIGSVSRMTITSRLPDSPLGHRVVLDYGRLIKVHEIGCSRGTIFEIRNLFGNTPARRKFLRTSKTEEAHIEEVVKNYALAAPTTTFILRKDQREILHFADNQALADRLQDILHYQGPLLEVGTAAEHYHCGHASAIPGSCGTGPSMACVHGYLLPPEASVAGSAGIRLLVNGRAVRDRLIVHAVAEGLRSFLMKGRSPAGFIHLRLPPEDVDVNVHPTKQEIRLHNSQAIHQLISQTVEQAMQEHQRKSQGAIFRIRPLQDQQSPPVPPAMVPAPPADNQQPALSRLAPLKKAVPAAFNCEQGLQTAEPEPPDAPALITPHPGRQHKLPAASVTGHGLKVIGHYDNLYIFCQSADGGLLVVDQHAAHERLLFENLKKQFLQGHIASQTLLFPVTIELSIAESECLAHHAAEINRMGFEIREFGGSSFIIAAIPAMAGHRHPGELFLDILSKFSGAGSASSAEEKKNQGAMLDDILASMACKGAIKAGDELQTREIDALLNSMAQAQLFSHCPHGRPVLKQFTAAEIKKWFYRS